MNDHTIKAFDEDIDRLRGLIAEMGGRAEAAIADAMTALTQRDAELAARVVADDKRIDGLEAEIERLAIQIIALRAPMANDLRDVIAALKIVSIVERIADYAKNIAKRVPAIGAVLTHEPELEPLSLLPSMAGIAAEMVHDALDAFAARDQDKAAAVVARDKAVDDFYDAIFRALVTHMTENPGTITESAHLLFVAKNLERIGDHATNVAEMVYFAATGTSLPEREKGDGPSEEGV